MLKAKWSPFFTSGRTRTTPGKEEPLTAPLPHQSRPRWRGWSRPRSLIGALDCQSHRCPAPSLSGWRAWAEPTPTPRAPIGWIRCHLAPPLRRSLWVYSAGRKMVQDLRRYDWPSGNASQTKTPPPAGELTAPLRRLVNSSKSRPHIVHPARRLAATAVRQAAGGVLSAARRRRRLMADMGRRGGAGRALRLAALLAAAWVAGGWAGMGRGEPAGRCRGRLRERGRAAVLGRERWGGRWGGLSVGARFGIEGWHWGGSLCLWVPGSGPRGASEGLSLCCCSSLPHPHPPPETVLEPFYPVPFNPGASLY